MERLYRLEGLAVRRRGRQRLAVPRVPRPAAEVPNDTWGIDFVRDQLASGCRIRCGTLVGACTRESLMITVHHSLPSVAVIAALDAVIATRGQPVRLSLDNGSEFRSRAFDAWAADRGITVAFIQPGKPIQNAHIESYNGRFRDECLDQHYFLSLADACFHIERWRRAYNDERPNEACHPLTPSEYARTFQTSHQVRRSTQQWRMGGGTLKDRSVWAGRGQGDAARAGRPPLAPGGTVTRARRARSRTTERSARTTGR
ncbi:MAG: transposase family protein [Gemmatimonadetes bacterium]|nr:transposase family protein [Gemmatimonadota bacterium]